MAKKGLGTDRPNWDDGIGPKEYPKVAWRFAKLMKLQDPTIEFIVAGVAGNTNWYRFPPRQGPVRLAIDEWGLWAGGQGGREVLWNLEQAARLPRHRGCHHQF